MSEEKNEKTANVNANNNKKTVIVLRDTHKEYRQIMRTDNAIAASLTDDKFDYAKVSQASASDHLITSILKSKEMTINDLAKVIAKDARATAKLQAIIETNKIQFKDKADAKSVLQRVKRHLTSDTVSRLKKREVSLT
jgi:hypothetical protein